MADNGILSKAQQYKHHGTVISKLKFCDFLELR